MADSTDAELWAGKADALLSPSHESEAIARVDAVLQVQEGPLSEL